MRVLFVYSLDDTQSVSKPLWSWSCIQFGISYISSVLQTEGHVTRLVVLGSNNEYQKSIKITNTIMSEFTPQVVCFTAVASQYQFINKIASAIKSRWPEAFMVIGGVHATLNPADVMNDSFDAVCIGEGEYPTLELCRQLEAGITPHGIANLWIRSPEGEIEKNSTRPFINDIDDLPFPDRAMWAPWVKEQRGAELSVLLGRGCPYNCTYCCNHALKQSASGKYVRFRSPENIIQEISFLHKAFPTQTRIFFQVESIALNKAWLLNLCEQLVAYNTTIDGFISYDCSFRISPQSVDEGVFVALRKANIHKINIGLESGSERVRRDILHRDYSNIEFLDATAMARKAGLGIYVFNMIGLPGETYSDHMETVSLNRQCQPDGHYTGIFYPYPGTDLYDLCIREGYISKYVDNRLERRQPVISFPQFTKRQIQEAYAWFNYRVYRGYKPLWWILVQTLRTRIRSSISLNILFRRILQWPALDYLREKLIGQK